MKIKIILFLTVTSLFFFLGCQNEFCVDTGTPQLILRLYNKDTITKPKSLNLVVWAQNKDSLFEGQPINTDSLAIPLDTKNNSTTYFISQQVDADNVSTEQITITYTTEDIFVSKSCGFKTVFNNVEITTTTNNWLTQTTLTTTAITDEKNAHVQLFH